MVCAPCGVFKDMSAAQNNTVFVHELPHDQLPRCSPDDLINTEPDGQIKFPAGRETLNL